MLRWLLSKLSPVPKLDYERVKFSCPNDESKRRRRYDGDAERHRLKPVPKLVIRKRGVA
jgi:hypothetical protein